MKTTEIYEILMELYEDTALFDKGFYRYASEDIDRIEEIYITLHPIAQKYDSLLVVCKPELTDSYKADNNIDDRELDILINELK